MAPAFLFPADGWTRKEREAVAIPLPDLGRELDARLAAMGFELVLAEWAGSPRRPILRIRMDLPDSKPGRGVSVDQCARVSRELEGWLDDHPQIPERYVLEVSSPGVERPLVRPGDWMRFRGERARVKGKDLPGGKGNRVEGEIVGLDEAEEAGGGRVILQLDDGERLSVPLGKIENAHLLYRWE